MRLRWWRSRLQPRSGWPPAKPSWISVWPGELGRSRCRLPLRGQRICGTACAAHTTCSASTKPTGGDEVFRQLVCARIIEPTSKQDSLRVLEETGVVGPSYPTLNRRLPVFAKAAFRKALSKACADHAALGPASLVLYDVSTLYFETDAGDGFREPGFSNYAELAVMPRSWWLWWRWCCSAVLVRVARAA
jgi:hypothetical protein